MLAHPEPRVAVPDVHGLARALADAETDDCERKELTAAWLPYQKLLQRIARSAIL